MIRKSPKQTHKKSFYIKRVKLFQSTKQANQEFEWLIGKHLSFSWAQAKESLLIAINDSMLLDVRLFFVAGNSSISFALWSRNKLHHLHPDIARASLNERWRLQLVSWHSCTAMSSKYTSDSLLPDFILTTDTMNHQRKPYEMHKKRLYFPFLYIRQSKCRLQYWCRKDKHKK